MVSTRVGYRGSIFVMVAGCVATMFGPCDVLAQNVPVDGRALFVAEKKGNCAACHKTSADPLSKGISMIGPPLESIRQKYPDPAERTRLRNTIWDASKTTPETVMPPYGKHHILTEAEIDVLVTYLETL